MERLTESDIESLDIEYFLESEGVDFKVTQGVSGTQLNIQICPSCGNEKWKTYFGLETGKGNCFSCGAGFSRASLVHAHYKRDRAEWAQTFQDIRRVLSEQGWRPKRAAMVRVEVGEVKLPNSFAIPNETGGNIAYLSQRGISDDIAFYFGLRLCNHGWWIFNDDKGDTQVQDFSGRVIIPVCDLDGQVKTFQGRDIIGVSDRKYLFPKNLPGTGRYILNGHNCVASKRACLGEGFFDVAATKIAFDEDVALRDVVAMGSFGKHLSYGDKLGDDQLGRFRSLRKRGLQEVTIMWDGEVKALEAALDAAQRLRSAGLAVRVALLPFGKDPNEVPAERVRAAYYGARAYTDNLHLQWRLENPYSKPSLRKKYGVV